MIENVQGKSSLMYFKNNFFFTAVSVQSKDRLRATSDPVTKFPPIQNGPYPNFVGQGGWQQIPETQVPHREVAPGKNRTLLSS